MSGMTSTVIDLDALRAARAEATAEPITLTFAGDTYTVAPDIRYSVLRKMQRNDLDGALVDLLGPDQADRLLNHPDLTMADVTVMLERIITQATGTTAGEASGSSHT